MANATPESGGGYIWDGKVNLQTNPWTWNPTSVIESVFGQPTDTGREAYERHNALNPPLQLPSMPNIIPSLPDMTTLLLYLGGGLCAILLITNLFRR